MLARVATFAIEGLDPRPVWVEVDIRPGLPAFTVVGLADAAVREARERVRAAILNSGFQFPLRRITANLAPACLRKVGPGFDLALAAGVLAASGQVGAEALARYAVFGELSLGGELRPCAGALAVAEGTRASGLQGLVLPPEGVAEAALVDGIEVVGTPTLRTVAELLDGRPPEPARRPASAPAGDGAGPDLADVRGQAEARLALEIAAAGGHNLLLEGPPGTGKTMLARRLPGILPPLSRHEALEVTRIHSVTGLRRGQGLVRRRPFRAPHHTISAPGLVGGGAAPSPGEATLAHRGVLFLDELSEFSRAALDALRQPLEDRRVTVVRGQRSVVFPTAFMLVAATNPCRCGHAGDPDRCSCAESDLARHRRRLSGPLLDRIDLQVPVGRPSAAALAGPAGETSEAVRARVVEARARQERRAGGAGAPCNADLDGEALRRAVVSDAPARRLLARSYDAGVLSARGVERVLRVARTVADLGARERVSCEDVLTALHLRRAEHPAGEAAA